MSFLGDLFKTVAGPVIGAVSSIFGANKAASSAERVNEQNIDFATDNREWQERMANSAHQRHIEDLRKAGLNPILSANTQGAGTPNPQLPQLSNASAAYSSAYNNVGQIASSAYGTLVQKATIENLREQAATQRSQQMLNSATSVKTAEEARRNMIENDYLETERTRKSYEETRRNKRPNWIKNIGIDVRDTSDTLLGPIKDLFRR